MWLLSRREYSAKELVEKLTGRGYPADEARAALVVMQGYGFQDDRRFAEARARSTGRRMGDRRVAADLVDKGVSRELAAEKLEELAPEAERALQAVSKFEGRQLDEATRAKVWRFLAYRGFSGSAIKAALNHLKAAMQTDAEI